MKAKNECRTYFKIVGDFDPSEITARLGIEPSESWGKTDLRRDGEPFGFSLWECGRCDEYDVYAENQMRKTIEALKDKTDELNRIREEFDVTFWLVVVPELYVDEITQCLAPSLDVMDFCTATRTQIDVDLYLYPNT